MCSIWLVAGPSRASAQGLQLPSQHRVCITRPTDLPGDAAEALGGGAPLALGAYQATSMTRCIPHKGRPNVPLLDKK